MYLLDLSYHAGIKVSITLHEIIAAGKMCCLSMLGLDDWRVDKRLAALLYHTQEGDLEHKEIAEQ